MDLLKQYINQAEANWDNNKELSLVMALLATSATARKRYPKPPHSDSQSFTLFIQDYAPAVLTGNFEIIEKGKRASLVLGDKPLEEILYKELRCNVVHEARMPENVTLSQSKIVDGSVHSTISIQGDKFMIPSSVILNLIKMVKEAPENEGIDWS